MFKTAKAYEELEKLSPLLARQSLTAEAVERNLRLAIDLMRTREIDLLQRKQRAEARVAPPESEEAYQSPFMWYVVDNRIERYDVSPDGGETTYCVFYREGLEMPWRAALFTKYNSAELIGEISDAAEAYCAADMRIAETHESTILIERSAPWTRYPASEKQLAALAGHIPMRSERRSRNAPQYTVCTKTARTRWPN